MARSSTSGPGPVRTAGVHQLHTCNDTSFRCIRLIYRNRRSDVAVGAEQTSPGERRDAAPARSRGATGSGSGGPVVRPRARRYPGPMGFRPGALDGLQTSPTGGQVEYLLARNSVIREFRKGRLSRLDVCDAHPELIRAASNLGRPIGEQCPICEESDLVEVTFVFGAKLPVRWPVRGHPDRAHPVLAPQGAGGLLRRRGLLRLPVEPPAAHVPGGRRRRCRGPQAAAQPHQGLIPPLGRRTGAAVVRSRSAVRCGVVHTYSAGPPADAAGSLRALDGRRGGSPCPIPGPRP